MLLPGLLAALLAQAPLTTTAERSNWTRTARYAEVESLCRDFPKAFPGKVRCETFGTTPEGRPMLALVASADGTLTPAANVKKARPVLFFQGGIHAGEIDGKDAGFWLLREVLAGKALPGVLRQVTAVFVPVVNVDGHERFGPNNRPNQVGPEEMGWRVTAQNLNMNRDYAKADAPEMVALLKLLHAWDPLVYWPSAARRSPSWGSWASPKRPPSCGQCSTIRTPPSRWPRRGPWPGWGTPGRPVR
jgi:murein tripeptide amidase MpaA